MLKPLRSNPLLDQTLHAGRWPSPRVTLVLLIALLSGSMVSRAWLIDHLPAEARAVLLLLLWLLPLVTMAVAAVSTARRLRTEAFQLIRQSPLTDRQVTWGLGFSTLYTLRLMLALAFGLLPALVDDTPLGGASTALCLAGLHLAASMLGTALMLRWGRQRLGVVLAALCCTLIVALLPTMTMLLSPILAPGCPSTSLHPVHLRLNALLLDWGLHGLLPVMIAAVLPALIGLAAGLLPWRGRADGRQSQLETLGLVLGVGLVLGLWVLDASQVEVRERQALVALYNATGGENWTGKSGWMSDQPVCYWQGVGCACGRITALDRRSSYLKGELPPELGQLTNLQTLSLSGNKISRLTPEIGQLTNLQFLYIEHNQLTEVPSEIGQLSDLQWLEIQYNQLSRLPPEIGQLTDLQRLDLHSNQLSKLPPEIGQLSNLQWLDIRFNRLRVLPPEIGQLSNLQWLTLDNNKLSKLPPEIGQLTSLHVLSLDSNKLSELPPEVGQLPYLVSLQLQDNELSGLPSAICQKPYLQIPYVKDALCGE